jgi:hypothetical protein
MDFNLPVAAYPGRSLMLQAFTGVSKVEKAQRNRCQTSPSKFGQRSQQTNRRRGSTASPALGSGRIFPVSEESIAIDAVPLARHWPQIGGLDFGWDHPTAAAKLAWDRDVVYVTATYPYVGYPRRSGPQCCAVISGFGPKPEVSGPRFSQRSSSLLS